MMTLRIRAHFDGQVIVPDQKVDLPIDAPLEVNLTPLSGPGGQSQERLIAERLRKLSRATGCLSGPTIPADALRRENFYE